MRLDPLFLVLLLSAGMLCGLPTVAQATHYQSHHSHVKHHHHKTEACCTTAKMRFAQGGAEYCAGCRAAATYVEGKDIGQHGKEWNNGFSDCRFNVYRSNATEIKAEKTICGYTPCCR